MGKMSNGNKGANSRRRDNKMDIRIYAGNLSNSTTQEEINTLFTTIGTIFSTDIVNAHFLANNTLESNLAKPCSKKTATSPPPSY
jgi:hypothetical protein